MKYSNLSPHFLSITRIVIAFLFMAHGSQKLFNFPPSERAMSFDVFSLLWIAGVLELFGGLFLLIGFHTRFISFILCGEMAVAFFKAHAGRGFWPILNGGELAVLYCFIFLYFSVAGGGKWSADVLLRGKQ
jgi:putative oxidoreductase